MISCTGKDEDCRLNAARVISHKKKPTASKRSRGKYKHEPSFESANGIRTNSPADQCRLTRRSGGPPGETVSRTSVVKCCPLDCTADSAECREQCPAWIDAATPPPASPSTY
ncbi:hypothetical protein TKK_0011916 [Trichogramma kaykai]